MNKRVEYLDTLKAIAIFLVVFCHFVLLSETVTANVLMCACWMAVPIFFMVNGALLFVRPLQLNKHWKKTASVYLVMVVWKLIYMLVIPAAAGETLTDCDIWQILNYLFLFGELPGVVNGHLWFIEALLCVYLLFPLLRIVYALKEGGGQRNTGRRLLWLIAAAALLMTNGLYSFEVLGDMLRDAGISMAISTDSLAAFQPFGKYGNMLGFFLLGALLADGSGPSRSIGGSLPAQRLLGGTFLAGGLMSLTAVKWFLSGQLAWDGRLLQEGYRHVPVIFMAVGLFLLCKDGRLRVGWLTAFIRALSKRTLGIFYIHWLLGWLLVEPLANWLAGCGLSFGVGANLLKNLVLMVPAFLLTCLLERVPLVKKLVTVG